MQNENQFRALFLDRSRPYLTVPGIEQLRSKTVAIAGCGGVGGNVVVPLCRMGIGRFHLADPNDFDLPDLNRQYGATCQTLGQNKALTYGRLLTEINPYLHTRIWEEGVREDNLDDFLHGVDLLIDSLDLATPLTLRAKMLETARRLGIFSINSPVLGFGTFIFCSDPKGMSLEPVLRLIRICQGQGFPQAFKQYFFPEHIAIMETYLRRTGTTVPSIAISTMVAGAAAATEAIAALLDQSAPQGRPPVVLPEVLAIDFYGNSYKRIQIDALFRGTLETLEAAGCPKPMKP